MDKGERIKNWVNNGLYTLLPAVDFLDEFAEYSKSKKAEIVYRKCLRNRKYTLAEKIKQKYNIVNKHDDSVVAFGLALMALNGR
jgi:hemerythrin-like domain-containing protein